MHNSAPVTSHSSSNSGKRDLEPGSLALEAAELWKSNNGARFVAEAPPQYFWPCGLELFGAPGPHYLALLDYLAAALEEESFGGSAQHLSRLLRRTMCKLLHDLMGQKILRKIKQLN